MYVRHCITDDHEVEITSQRCYEELKDKFVHPEMMLEALRMGKIDKIHTDHYYYKLSKKRKYYNLIVSIKYPSDMSKKDFIYFMESYDTMWDNDGNIVINEGILEKAGKDSYKFEFLGAESMEGEEIKIWR